MEKYEVKFSNDDYNIGNFLSLSDEEFLCEPNYKANRTLFLAYELTSIEQILRLASNLNEKSMVLLYYKDERYLYELLSKVDFTAEDYKIMFFAGDYKDTNKVNELDNLLGKLIYSFSNIQPMVKKSENIDYIRGAKEFLKFIGDFRDNYTFLLGNDLNDTLCGLRNRLLNIPAYVKNPGFKGFVEKYGSIYRNKPAIIVASGPSLDKNVHHLKEFQGKALILSCDGSLSTLESHGIKPDIVGSVERAYRTYEAFYKDRNVDPEIVFSAPAVVRPEIVEKFADKYMISVFKDKDVYGKWINEITLSNKGTIWSGSSVAHFLMSFADGLGCSPIILIGQDLSYSLEGISHAGDTEIREQVDVSKITEWVKDYNGNDIPSTFIWKRFLQTFEEMVRNTDKTVIDATEGGALIKGTLIKGLRETLEEYCKEELPSFYKLVSNMAVPEDYIKAARESTFTSIVNAIGVFDELLSKVRKGIKENKKSIDIAIKGIKTQKQLDGIYDTLDFVDEKIVKVIAVDSFFMMLFQHPIYSAIRSINNLNTDKYTLDALHYNLALHRDMLQIFELYINKMLKVLINGLSDIGYFLGELPDYEDKLKKLKEEYKYLFKSKDYDIELI